MNFKSITDVYGLDCNLYGLLYVDGTKGRLNKRMCGHISDNINSAGDIVYHIFNLSVYLIRSMQVHIIEKIYHRTNNPHLAPPHRRQKRTTGFDNWKPRHNMVAMSKLLVQVIFLILLVTWLV